MNSVDRIDTISVDIALYVGQFGHQLDTSEMLQLAKELEATRVLEPGQVTSELEEELRRMRGLR